MRRLFLHNNGNKTLWCGGWAFYLSHQKAGASRLPVAVKCRLGNLEIEDYALLDTGAEWSVVGGETAKDLLDRELGSPIKSLTMSTRLGLISGEVHRLSVHFLTEQDSDIDLTVAAPYWSPKNGKVQSYLGIGVCWREFGLPLIPVSRPVSKFFISERMNNIKKWSIGVME